jgi:hypothetical protein
VLPLEFLSHLVERGGQHADFIGRMYFAASAEIASRHQARCPDKS